MNYLWKNVYRAQIKCLRLAKPYGVFWNACQVAFCYQVCSVFETDMKFPGLIFVSQDSPGLFDPCEKTPTDAVDNLKSQQREEITASAQVNTIYMIIMENTELTEFHKKRWHCDYLHSSKFIKYLAWTLYIPTIHARGILIGPKMTVNVNVCI